MAEIASSTFSQTDASNTSSPGLSGSSAPSQIDDSIRGNMGAIKREHDWRNLFLTTGGSANAYTLTYSVAPAAYYTGQTFSFTASFACTGSATLNVNGLGAKTIKKDVAGTMTALSSGDIASGAKIIVNYDGTDFIWINKGVAATPSGSITSSGYTQTTSRLLGRTTASTGAIEEISVGSGLTLSGGSLSASGGTAVTVVRHQVFTASGTYTPHANMLYCRVIATGCGGGGGGADTGGAGTTVGAGGGGGAGGTAIKVFSAATIGASQTVTIGSAGTAGSATNGASGGNGGNTTFGALLTANGGSGGTGSGNSSNPYSGSAGGAGGTASSGDINVTGGSGGGGIGLDAGTNAMALGGTGGASYWGGGGSGGALGTNTTAATAGTAGGAYGSGGGGGAATDSAGGAGGAGIAGVVYVEEYCSA